MRWAQRLKRVFNIDIETCSACGGTSKVTACIEDPAVIEKILTHLDNNGRISRPVGSNSARFRGGGKVEVP